LDDGESLLRAEGPDELLSGDVEALDPWGFQGLNGLSFSGLLGLVLLPNALYEDDFFSLAAGDGAGALELAEVPQLDAEDEVAPNVVDEDKPEREVPAEVDGFRLLSSLENAREPDFSDVADGDDDPTLAAGEGGLAALLSWAEYARLRDGWFDAEGEDVDAVVAEADFADWEAVAADAAGAPGLSETDFDSADLDWVLDFSREVVDAVLDGEVRSVDAAAGDGATAAALFPYMAYAWLSDGGSDGAPTLL
jgi:hypothetical protein